MNRLVSLYPAAWRARYEAEFLDLLAAAPPTVDDRLDIVHGALDAHLRDLGPRHGRDSDPFWVVSLGGFLSFGVALVVAANGPLMHDDLGTYRDGVAAMPFLLFAMLAMIVAIGASMSHLPRSARVPRAGGYVAIGAGLLWALGPWVMPLLVAFLGGLILLVAGVRRACLWPAWSEAVVVALLTPVIGVLVALMLMPWWVSRAIGLDLTPAIAAIGTLWPLLALLLRRGFPRVSEV